MASLTPTKPETAVRVAPPMTRPASVPRPTTQTKATPSPMPRTTAQLMLADTVVPGPPPVPRRPSAKPSRPSPPPLPKTVRLADADLIDEQEVTHVARTPIPTSFDVEIDCFSRTEPPPESRPRRKRTLLALVTGLVLVAATGVTLLARSATPHAAAASPTPPVAARTPVVANASPKSLEAQPCASASAATRLKPSPVSKREKTALASSKKPTKPLRSQAASHRAQALY